MLYRAFGISGYHCVRTEYLEDMVVFRIEQKRDTPRCPVCGSAWVTAHCCEDRWFRLVPVGRKLVRLFFRIPRGECGQCHVTCQVHVPFAEPLCAAE
ncbi:MAG: hypothetical protein K1X57_13580 [Gemmataceae bacterium]|nr:hypothetical protein [Gemmataceae bacterium]